ncbi:A/G-specific adenine glycosylase [Flavobacterium psychrotolerans]|uniref:Adenine DNA glycosylase n=1 Tax=Flavobacterium psychrotolerans TaxID=2169410 RepID=A0A2U1JH95_9FLAO|nr:A/G-specific adenine glycosylase [Flavobacterium psychrotolerans]PWA04506.1 A/G-specific adenine glycosylase [Flavobacterium psychrotolerans]
MNFTNSLTKWYLQNKRDLPWRNTQNPYFIWLSEIMLQQTRVAQGMPYFFAFSTAFPTVFELANASEEQVLKLWQGLGYYSRARNLHKTAQKVAFELNGIFPTTYNDLLKLKGIGDYTAAAIASFSYNEAVPVVDGNVFRVLSRYFDIETDIASASAKKEFASIAFELMTKNARGGAELSEANPALFNQAIMEFGALQCVPKSPNCEICVLNSGCLALKRKKVGQLPVKSKKTKVRNRYFNYIIFSDVNENTLIQKRSDKGIWHNLYEFPLIETETEEDFEFISAQIQEQPMVENGIISISELSPKSQIHKLSHQHLHIKFWKVNVNETLENGIDYETLLRLPFPIVIFNFIEKEWK